MSLPKYASDQGAGSPDNFSGELSATIDGIAERAAQAEKTADEIHFKLFGPEPPQPQVETAKAPQEPQGIRALTLARLDYVAATLARTNDRLGQVHRRL